VKTIIFLALVLFACGGSDESMQPHCVDTDAESPPISCICGSSTHPTTCGIVAVGDSYQCCDFGSGTCSDGMCR